MPEFEKPYTYGIGRFSYVIKLSGGDVSVHLLGTDSKLLSPEAIAYHLSEVKKLPGFRYL